MRVVLAAVISLTASITQFGQARCPQRGVPRNRALEIVFTPKVSYPPDVRAAVQGPVTLRVEFLGKGTVGRVSVVKGLPYGLTEVALKAARGIKFKPEIKACEAVDVSRPIMFNFTRY